MLQGIALSRLNNKVEGSIIERRALAMKHRENAIREALLRPVYDRIPAVNQSINSQQPMYRPAYMQQRPQIRPNYQLPQQSIDGLPMVRQNPGVMQMRPEGVRNSIVNQGSVPQNASGYQSGVSVRSSMTRPNIMQPRAPIQYQNTGTVRSSMVGGSQATTPMQQRVAQNVMQRPIQGQTVMYPTGQINPQVRPYTVVRPPASTYQNPTTVRTSQTRSIAPMQSYGANQMRPGMMPGYQPRPAPAASKTLRNTAREESNAEGEESEGESGTEQNAEEKQESVAPQTNPNQLSQQSQSRIVPVLNKNDGKIYYIPIEKMMAARMMNQQNQ